MSILTTAASRKEDKRDAFALVLVLVVICLGNLVLVLASEPFARAVELTGQF